MERREPTSPDLQAYLRVIKRRKLTIGFVTVAVVALALGYSFAKTPTYTATTQLLIPSQTAASVLQPTDGQLQPAAASSQRLLIDAQQFALGGQTKAAALAALHFQPHVTVEVSATADVLTFATRNADKIEAAKIANTYAQAYISASGTNEVSKYTGQVLALQASITELQRHASELPANSEQKAASTASITLLTQSLQELQVTSELVAQTGPSVISAARPPSSPSSPKPRRNGELALVLGLLLGLGSAFVKDHLDDKVKSVVDVEESSGGLPIVGTIPVVDSWKKDSAPHIAFMEDLHSNASEAYRTLRTAIQFLGIEESQKVIGITSSTPDEGKSTAAANLAVSFARAGQEVVVVSLDFRRPRLHQFFGLDNNVGATSVLVGESELIDALKTVPNEPHIRVLTSGPVPPNPAELLSLDGVRRLVDTLAANAEVILLDCPPILPVTDTLLISRLCDTMLVVTVAGRTRKGDLRRTYDLLGQIQAPVRGTILNRIPNRGAYAYGYGYGYGYGSGYAPQSPNVPSSVATTARPEEAVPVEMLQPILVGGTTNGNHGDTVPSPERTGKAAGLREAGGGPSETLKPISTPSPAQPESAPGRNDGWLRGM